MSDILFLISFAVCFASALIANLLHFRTKFRLLNAGFAVKWMMMPWDDWRMWKTYRTEAPKRNWPLWPFHLYQINFIVFIASGFAVLANAHKLERYLG